MSATDTGRAVFWNAIRDGYSYQEAARRQQVADTASQSGPVGFTLDDAGRRVADGWDHDGDLVAGLQGDLNRQQEAGDALAQVAGEALQALWGHGGEDGPYAYLSRAIETWRAAR